MAIAGAAALLPLAGCSDDSGSGPDQSGHAPQAVLDGPGDVLLLQGTFTLSANRSADFEGRISEYRFTNVDCGGLNGWLPGARISQTTGTLAVTPSGTAFAAGLCHFTLVVVDSAGVASEPVLRTVRFHDPLPPIAVLDMALSISAISAVELRGDQSTDQGGGRIVQYRWTNLDLQGSANLAVNATEFTTSPSFTVVPGPNGFATGTARMRLVVVDDSGNLSVPAEFSFTVQ